MAWRHCEQMKVVVLVWEVGIRLGERMLVVELGNVAAVRRREVCIDIVEARVWESSSSSRVSETAQHWLVYQVGTMRAWRLRQAEVE